MFVHSIGVFNVVCSTLASSFKLSSLCLIGKQSLPIGAPYAHAIPQSHTITQSQPTTFPIGVHHSLLHLLAHPFTHWESSLTIQSCHNGSTAVHEPCDLVGSASLTCDADVNLANKRDINTLHISIASMPFDCTMVQLKKNIEDYEYVRQCFVDPEDRIYDVDCYDSTTIWNDPNRNFAANPIYDLRQFKLGILHLAKSWWRRNK